MLLLYNFGVQCYGFLVSLFALFNTKAKLFVTGRKSWLENINRKIDSRQKHVWFHFASLGEFEQGRPVLEKLISTYPAKKVIVTFFSPSGYEIRKNYPLAEGVFYLPLDTPRNAKLFIEAINPEIAVFTKYEFWFHYFKELNSRQVPLFLISGIFRPGQAFFKPYGSFNRRTLKYVTHFFVQNEESVQLLNSINIQDVSLTGDTRFDRVAENAANSRDLQLIEKFANQTKVLVAGSTWPEDEQLLALWAKEYPNWKIIIAPHEIHESHLADIEKLFPSAITYSQLLKKEEQQKTIICGADNITDQLLIIDNIGLLSSLYKYGDIAYIGGGFGAGIHNTLEAAAFGLPILIGPKYQKFQEAKDLINIGAAISVKNTEELTQAFETLSENKEAQQKSAAYVHENKGATELILTSLSPYLQ